MLNGPAKKPLTIALSVAFALAVCLSIFLWLSWQKSKSDIQLGAEALTNLIQVNQGLNGSISTAQADIANTSAEIQSIEQELGQLTANKDTLLSEVDLYQTQKSYLSDVLNWFNQYYFFQEAGGLINAYAAATGNIEP